MVESRKKLGTKGEQLAANYLMKKEHKILRQNYRNGSYEIDIITNYKDILVFSEVKSNYKKPLADSGFKINKSKKNSIINGAYRFIDANPQYSDMDVRFDVLIVNFSVYPAEIEHYEAAFWQERFW
jgi:putative endonuclease